MTNQFKKLSLLYGVSKAPWKNSLVPCFTEFPVTLPSEQERLLPGRPRNLRIFLETLTKEEIYRYCGRSLMTRFWLGFPALRGF